MCKWLVRGCSKCVYHCWFGCGAPRCKYYGFCKWPHGCCYSVMAMFSAFASLYMNFTVVMSCFFLQITERNPVTGELIMSTRTGYGMLARQIEYGEPADYQQCLYYPDDEKHILEDSYMKGSTYSAFICAALQVIACAVLSTTCCCAYNRPCWERWMMWLYIYASCFMALTFLMYGTHFCTENDCDMANGGGFAISSWMFLVCCANVVKNMGQPPPEDMVDPDDDEDNLWYDDDADRFPQRYDEDDEDDYDDYDDYDGEASFGADEDYNDNDDQGVEMHESDFLDPDNQGGMDPYDPDQGTPYDPHPSNERNVIPPQDSYAGTAPQDPLVDPYQQDRSGEGFERPELV